MGGARSKTHLNPEACHFVEPVHRIPQLPHVLLQNASEQLLEVCRWAPPHDLQEGAEYARWGFLIGGHCDGHARGTRVVPEAGAVFRAAYGVRVEGLLYALHTEGGREEERWVGMHWKGGRYPRAQKEEKERKNGKESLWLLKAPVREIILQMHTPACTSHCWSRQTQHGLGVCIWMPLVNGTGNTPSPGRPTPGVVKQDKSSGGSGDSTKTHAFGPTEGQNEQWREANRRRQRQTIRFRGLVPTPPSPFRAPNLCPATIPLTSASFNGICHRQ